MWSWPEIIVEQTLTSSSNVFCFTGISPDVGYIAMALSARVLPFKYVSKETRTNHFLAIKLT